MKHSQHDLNISNVVVGRTLYSGSSPNPEILYINKDTYQDTYMYIELAIFRFEKLRCSRTKKKQLFLRAMKETLQARFIHAYL